MIIPWEINVQCSMELEAIILETNFSHRISHGKWSLKKSTLMVNIISKDLIPKYDYQKKFFW